MREHAFRLREIEEKYDRRDIEAQQLRQNLEDIERSNDNERKTYEELLVLRQELDRHAFLLKQANDDIEKEFDSFVQADDSIVKTLKERDDRYSPMRASTGLQPLIGARLNT